MSEPERFARLWRAHPEQRARVRRALEPIYRRVGLKQKRSRSPLKPRQKEIGGVETTLISLGDAAKRLGLSKRVLRDYDRRGIIPANSLLDAHGRRWWPLQYIEFLRPLLADQSKRKEPLWRLAQKVEQAWEEARDGVPQISPEESDERQRNDAGCDLGTDHYPRHADDEDWG